jgi:hypothetical protein
MSTVFFFLFFCILAIVLVSTALGLNFLEYIRAGRHSYPV